MGKRCRPLTMRHGGRSRLELFSGL